MNRFINTLSLFIIAILISNHIQAEVLWASKVIAFSSELDENAYSVQQALGPPSKLPAMGDCGCAWSPSMANSLMEEFLRVGFSKKIKVKQIIISENFNAGTIKYIYLYDQYNIEHLVYERKEMDAVYGRLTSIIIPQTDYITNDIKIILDTESVDGYNQIDAVGISDSETPVVYNHIDITDMITFKGEAEKLGSGINSFGAEITPLVSPDGKTLYFTRKDHPENTGHIMNDDVWYSTLIGNKWSAPQNAGSPINNENNNYVVGISEDGSMLTLGNTYQLDGRSRSGVAQTWITSEGTWKYPMNLLAPGLITFNLYAEYYMNPQRTFLLASLERGGGYGLKDLYVCFTENQVQWSDPINLGKDINTVSNEMAPFLSADGNYLYFSSDGYPGYGDLDVYVSKRLDDTWTHWTKPENLGSMVNSVGFDAYFTISPVGDYAYFSSSKDDYYNTDLYRIPLKDIPVVEEKEEPLVEQQTTSRTDSTHTENTYLEEDVTVEEKTDIDVNLTNDYLLFGTVFDASSELPIDASIMFKLKNYKADTINMPTLNHNYRMKITNDVTYNVTVVKAGYMPLEEEIVITDISTQKVKRVDFRITPIKKGEKFILDNLYFDANSAFIKPVSYGELNLLYQFLVTNPSVHIEIGGHTNGLCDDDYCVRLSNSRALAVVKYLTEKGIDPIRLSNKGYGKTLPIASNDTNEGRKKNQRVEVTIQ